MVLLQVLTLQVLKEFQEEMELMALLDPKEIPERMEPTGSMEKMARMGPLGLKEIPDLRALKVYKAFKVSRAYKVLPAQTVLQGLLFSKCAQSNRVHGHGGSLIPVGKLSIL